VGRHSSPEHAAFLRSLAGWFVPWFLVAAVAAAAVWVALAELRGPLEAQPPSAGPAPAAPSTPRHTQEAAPESSPTPEPSPSPEPTRRRKPKRSREPKPELITEGITVQVLDASRSEGAGAAMTARLESLGYEVVVTGNAATVYERTTVFWSFAAAQAAAEALAERFDWVARPRPANLSSSVSLHVVVGRDEV
jgi:outer membrane biosynthesis protein TonB